MKKTTMGVKNYNSSYDFFGKHAHNLSFLATEDHPWYEMVFFDGYCVEAYAMSVSGKVMDSVKLATPSPETFSTLPVETAKILTEIGKLGIMFASVKSDVAFEVDEEFKSKVKTFIGDGSMANLSIKALKTMIKPIFNSMIENVPLLDRLYTIMREELVDLQLFISFFNHSAIRHFLTLTGLQDLLCFDQSLSLIHI
eukprot:TRINITY_DN2077_c0_g1_i4.p1 TRINITY_DN2077_c0_g1~~TRINITY_DN2077_c0_g1_i4.p1  ORF type:complete len:197 (+),score=29.97 TRINITY_DN2077_c0_g1_i4:235-825(+)